jgi:hypothetical protein
MVSWLNSPALIGASAVFACRHALGAPLCAEEVWDGLCVHGNVGRYIVVADTGKCQTSRVTVVLDGVLSLDAGLL